MPPEPLRLELGAPARPEVLDALHDLLGRAWEHCPAVGPSDRMGVETAVAEIAANIVEHTAAGRAVDLTAGVTVRDDRIEVDLCDTGAPAPVEVTADEPTAMPEEMAERGRGLALVWALVDEFVYERQDGLNRWYIMCKRR